MSQVMMEQEPPRLSPSEAADLRRRRRGRNWAVMLVLFGLAALFYAITIVKMTKS